jgi:hypothetical protein
MYQVPLLSLVVCVVIFTFLTSRLVHSGMASLAPPDATYAATFTSTTQPSSIIASLSSSSSTTTTMPLVPLDWPDEDIVDNKNLSDDDDDADDGNDPSSTSIATTVGARMRQGAKKAKRFPILGGGIGSGPYASRHVKPKSWLEHRLVLLTELAQTEIAYAHYLNQMVELIVNPLLTVATDAPKKSRTSSISNFLFGSSASSSSSSSRSVPSQSTSTGSPLSTSPPRPASPISATAADASAISPTSATTPASTSTPSLSISDGMVPILPREVVMRCFGHLIPIRDHHCRVLPLLCCAMASYDPPILLSPPRFGESSVPLQSPAYRKRRHDMTMTIQSGFESIVTNDGILVGFTNDLCDVICAYTFPLGVAALINEVMLPPLRALYEDYLIATPIAEKQRRELREPSSSRFSLSRSSTSGISEFKSYCDRKRPLLANHGGIESLLLHPFSRM